VGAGARPALKALIRKSIMALVDELDPAKF
jgi:hypothetical protein